MARLSARERASLPDRAFAYIDATGQRRLPIHDQLHVRNALARFGQVAFDSDAERDRCRQRLLNAAKRHGIMPVGFLTSQLRTSRPGPALPTGSVTFLLTDIEGSTALLRQLEDAYAGLLRQVRHVISSCVRSAGGCTVDSYGDEYLAVFAQPGPALSAAVAIQRTLAAQPWPIGTTVRVRAGVHSGRPALTDTGYVGLSVHTVARICSVAHGGQILVSAQTVTALEPGLDGIGVASLGPHRLIGLPGPEELFQCTADGLIGSFPPLRLLT